MIAIVRKMGGAPIFVVEKQLFVPSSNKTFNFIRSLTFF